MSEHWANIIGAWLGNETDEEVEAFLNPPDAHEGTMSERLVGPLGHVMREFAAGNPGTQHLVGELAEAHKRLRECEGMMTRREVLELIVKRHRQYLEATNSASRSEHWGAVGGLSQVLGWPPAPGITVRNAAHELALLMNAEREEAD